MTRSRFFIVEDNPGDIRLMQIAIQRAQLPIELEVYRSGDEALKELKNRAEKEWPDLIILDINLPGMNGFEILSNLKSDSRLSHIPTFVMSSSESLKDRERAFLCGAINYFSKPSSIQSLQDLMLFFLDSTKLRESSK